MNIEADALRYDDLKQTSVFTGNVVVTKGTIIIRGARIDVRQDPEGYQYGVVTAAPGKLAYFKQKRDAGPDEWIEGEARGHRIRQPRRQREVHPPRRDAPPDRRHAQRREQRPADHLRPEQRHLHRQRLALPPNAGVATQPGGRVKAILTPKAAPRRLRAGSAGRRRAAPRRARGLRSTHHARRRASASDRNRRHERRHGAPGSRLEARGLQKSYGSRKVVKDVSLAVQKGEVVGLLGPNGAGKTTSFYMIVGPGAGRRRRDHASTASRSRTCRSTAARAWA